MATSSTGGPPRTTRATASRARRVSPPDVPDPLRRVVICRAPEDEGLAAALARELAERPIDGWPAGPEIAAEFASAELISRLAGCDGLVVVATPVAIAWPFARVEVRLARELSRAVIVVALGLGDAALEAWLRSLPTPPDAVRICADARTAALAVEGWSPSVADTSPAVVQFAAARAALLRVASHGGAIGELAAGGLDPGLLRAAALHLRAIGLVDFSGSLDDPRTTLITVG